MAEEHFTLTFDGTAVEGGRISVRQLAPSLIALSDAMQAAQEVVLSPEDPRVSLDIRASRDGSFAVDLLLSDATGLVEKAISLFSGRETTAAVNLGGLLGYVWAAIELAKRLRGRKIRNEAPAEPGSVRITLDNGDTFTVPREALRLFQDAAFRAGLEAMMTPLRSDGIDELRIDHRGQRVVDVSSSEVDAFTVPPVPDDLLLDSHRPAVVHLLNVAFQEGNKWRVTDGNQPFYVSISDQQFITSIMTSQESFARGDILRVDLHTRQFRTSDGLRTEHTITKVNEHIRGAQTIPLPLEWPIEQPPDEA